MMLLRRIGVRLASLVGVLVLLTMIVFAIQSTLPADPVRAYFGRSVSPSVIAAKRAELGLDLSVPQQYLRFLARLGEGDLGTSLRTRRAVADDLASFLPATLELAAAAACAAVALGFVIGLVGSRPGRLSRTVRMSSIAVAAAPTFLVGILGILVFYRWLGWLPPGQRTSSSVTPGATGFVLVDTLVSGNVAGFADALRHLILPAVALAIGPAVAIGRTLRSSLREVYAEEYIRTATAKGASAAAIVWRHALRNAMNPALQMAGLQMGLLLAGAVVVEVVFAWPGIGLYLQQGIAQSDFPAVIGVVLVLGVMYVVVNAVVDSLQVVVDPRLRGARVR